MPAKARLQHLLIAAALNVARLAAWFAGRPRATTRPSLSWPLSPSGLLSRQSGRKSASMLTRMD